MASLIDVTGLTLNTEEAKEIGQLILEKAFVNSELSNIHDIETGVAYDMQIPFAGQIADSLKASTGCTPNAGTGVKMTQKVWTPKIYDSRWEHCAADLNVLTKLFQKAQRMNPDFYDRIESQEMGVIYALIEQMLRNNLPAKVWFSDTAAAAAPAGAFGTGVDLGLYNVIDGLFKQIFADVPSTADNYVAIAENSGASYAAQSLGADKAFEYLQDAVNKADSRLISDPNAQILVTRSIADNYRSTLRNKTLGAGFIEIVEGGRPELYFDGVKVVVMYEWDRIIKETQNDGTKLNLPHRIVYTTSSNIPVATLSSDDFGTLDSFYDQYRKSNIVDVAFSLDAKHLEKYMTVAAY